MTNNSNILWIPQLNTRALKFVHFENIGLKVNRANILKFTREQASNCCLPALCCVCGYESDKINHMVYVCKEAEQNPLLLFSISLCGLADTLWVWGRRTGIRLGVRLAWYATRPPARLHEGWDQSMLSTSLQSGSLCIRVWAYVCVLAHFCGGVCGWGY